MTDRSDPLQAARAQWQWRGQGRPPFADVPRPGQVSVWDFPRPPQLATDSREVVVRWGGLLVARTRRAVQVLETAHPPSFYLPWGDVNRALLQPAPGGSFCEWKGPARYWLLVDERLMDERSMDGRSMDGRLLDERLVDGPRRLPSVAWSYPQPLPGAEALADCVAFYAHDLQCSVDGHAVRPQAGGFYGGWITPDLAGPFKGDAGSQGW